MKKRCIAVCSCHRKGKRCKMDAIYGDYCTIHFFKLKGLRIKKNGI